MTERRRFSPATSPKERLVSSVQEMRDKATELRPGPERDELIKKARRADTAAHIDKWVNSPGLRPPK